MYPNNDSQTAPALCDPRHICLTLSPTRPTVELGELWEVTLEIENNTDHDIWIVNLACALIIPGEILHPSTAQFQQASLGGFPTATELGGTEYIRIPTNGQYTVVFQSIGGQYKKGKYNQESIAMHHRLAWHFFFHPGTYLITSTVHIWTKQPETKDIESAKQFGRIEECPEERREEVLQREQLALENSTPFNAASSITVVPKSITILLGAMFGGSAAFIVSQLFILAKGEISTNTRYWLFPAYMLFAVVLTLLTQRIAGFRFPFTVKVMDLWGAIALGIIAGFTSEGLLRTIQTWWYNNPCP